MKRTLLAATALPLFLLGSVALAQQTGAGLVEVEDDSAMVEPFARSVDQLEDMDLVSATGEEVGEVDEVLMNADGEIAAITADVGGFLGIGDHDVVLQLDQVEMQDDSLVVDMTREQLEQLPEWED